MKNYSRAFIIKLVFTTLTVAAIIIFIFFNNVSRVKTNKPSICCTTSIIAQTIKEIVKDSIDVVYLMGPDIDPHLYRARPSDIFKLSHADCIVYNGLHLEGKMAEILEQQKKPNFSMGDSLPRELLRESEYKGIYDPHIWADVKIWMKSVEQLSLFLQKTFPIFCEKIKHNTACYLDELNLLDGVIRLLMNEIPPHKRILITAHDAFGYFGKAYGLSVEGLQGISTDAEVRSSDIDRVASIIIKNAIPTIFVEQTVVESYLHSLKNIVENYGHTVHIGKHLYSDALGDSNSLASTYKDMMMYNAKCILEGLTRE